MIIDGICQPVMFKATNKLGGGQHHTVEALDLSKEAKVNTVYLCLNCTLWHTSTEDHEIYRENVDEYVQAIKARGMRYLIRMHREGIEKVRIAGPGSNYKICRSETVKPQAMQFYADIARIYGDDPDFLGITPLNEPYRGCEDTSIQENVLDFYREAIEVIRSVNPSVCVWLMYPCKCAGLPIEWKKAGYPVLSEYPRVGIEYHNHYFNWDGRWGAPYKESAEAGRISLDQWLTENVDPVLADGYEIILGEFSADLTTTRWPDVLRDQIELNRKRGVGYTLWRIRSDDPPRGLLTNSGTEWAENGQGFHDILSALNGNGNGNGGEEMGKVKNISQEVRTFNLINREEVVLQPGEEKEVPSLQGDIELT